MGVALVSPETGAADIDRHNAVFAEFADAVTPARWSAITLLLMRIRAKIAAHNV